MEDDVLMRKALEAKNNEIKALKEKIENLEDEIVELNETINCLESQNE